MSTAMHNIPLPDPVTQPEFFEGVPLKRFLAWVLDVIAITIIAVVIATLPFFLGWFIIGVIYFVVLMVYFIGSISRHSATPGMRLMNIELRDRDGGPLQSSDAAFHTITFWLMTSFLLPLLVSVALILFSPRGQGLHDMLLGVIVINKPSRY